MSHGQVCTCPRRRGRKRTCRVRYNRCDPCSCRRSHTCTFVGGILHTVPAPGAPARGSESLLSQRPGAESKARHDDAHAASDPGGRSGNCNPQPPKEKRPNVITARIARAYGQVLKTTLQCPHPRSPSPQRVPQGRGLTEGGQRKFRSHAEQTREDLAKTSLALSALKARTSLRSRALQPETDPASRV